jgi:outer membrane beta-barrel protein
METRIRVLLLSLVVLSLDGCALFHRHAGTDAGDAGSGRDTAGSAASANAASPDGDSAPPSVIEPQVERRDVKVPKIHPSNIELGGYYGEISIQDFGAQPVAGVRADYHVSEDFFFEATYGRATAGKTSFEYLTNVELLSNAERRFTYYDLSLGYNFLPGEVFIGRNLAMTSTFYMIGGIGSVKFAGDQNFAVNFGAGFRVLPTDWLALHIDVQDLVFKSDVIGISQLKNNLQATIGATVFF